MAAVSVKRSILHFHIAHNAPRLPAKFLHNYFSLFVLGNTVVPREIEDNGYAKFCGINKVQYGLCENGEYSQPCFMIRKPG